MFKTKTEPLPLKENMEKIVFNYIDRVDVKDKKRTETVVQNKKSGDFEKLIFSMLKRFIDNNNDKFAKHLHNRRPILPFRLG